MPAKAPQTKPRKPARSLQVPPQPPAKRSGHVGLLVMGTLAVGVTAYSLMPGESCERSPNAASPSLQQGNAECPSRGSSSSSGHGGSSRSSYYSSDSSSGHSSSSTSPDSGAGHVTRGGFGAVAHAFTSHFSGGG